MEVRLLGEYLYKYLFEILIFIPWGIQGGNIFITISGPMLRLKEGGRTVVISTILLPDKTGFQFRFCLLLYIQQNNEHLLDTYRKTAFFSALLHMV